MSNCDCIWCGPHIGSRWLDAAERTRAVAGCDPDYGPGAGCALLGLPKTAFINLYVFFYDFSSFFHSGFMVGSLLSRFSPGSIFFCNEFQVNHARPHFVFVRRGFN